MALDLLIASSGVEEITQPYPWVGNYLDSIYRINFTNYATVDALITGIESLPFVDFAEKYPLCSEYHTPNDLHAQQWYLPMVNAQSGWDFTTGSSNVKIAIVDNGVAMDHEDLNASIYVNNAEASGLPLVDDDLNGFVDDVNGFDVSNQDADPRPPNGSSNSSSWKHGTHVAGIAAASTNNAVGMAGLGYNCTIIPVKCASNSSDGGTFNKAIDGVFYGIRSGADVINMSFGTPVNSAVFHNMIIQASAQNIVLVAAAGNDGISDPFYPAAYTEVISVGATDENDVKASFSNFGNTIGVMAPGVNMYSTLIEGNNTYGNINGTSMASPLVAGLAGLIQSHFPGLSAAETRSRIENGCDNISASNPGMNGQIGSGRINVFNSLSNVSIANNKVTMFSVFPNPVESGGTIYLDKSFTADGTILSITGKKHPVQIQNGSISLPSKIAAGIHILQFITENQVHNHKITIR